MRKRLSLLILFAALISPFVIYCGKKAPPLPPIIIAPEPPGGARVRQSGDKLIFFFQLPVLNTDEETLADIEKIEIYRLKEPRIAVPSTQTQTAPTQTQSGQTQPQTQTQSQPQTQTQIQPQIQTQPQTQQTQTTQSQTAQTQTQTQTGQTQAQTQSQSTQSPPVKEEEAREVDDKEFESRGELIAEIQRDQIDGYLRENMILFVDPVNIQEGSEDLQTWFYYGAKAYNSKKKTAGYSKLPALFPSIVPKAPSNFTAKLAEKEMELTWNEVTKDAAGKPVPQGTVRYNIFRGNTANFIPQDAINSEPLNPETWTDTPTGKQYSYKDTTFEFGKPYYYFIRAHYSDKKRGQESEPSNVILIYPQDTFPPKAPEELNVVSAREGMVLIWAPNIEEDVAGYNIYRSTTSQSGFTKINSELIRETTYTDKDIQPGQRYYYVITAVDSAPVPNESEKSAETFEVARKQ